MTTPTVVRWRHLKVVAELPAMSEEQWSGSHVVFPLLQNRIVLQLDEFIAERNADPRGPLAPPAMDRLELAICPGAFSCPRSHSRHLDVSIEHDLELVRRLVRKGPA
jgi:hypothetical protein